jgi:hypothetical protein
VTDWKWDDNPNEEYLTAGLPVGVIAEVERIATEIAARGIDAEVAGIRPDDAPGGLRNFPLFGGRVPRGSPTRVHLRSQHHPKRVNGVPLGAVPPARGLAEKGPA